MGGECDSLSNFFEQSNYGETNLVGTPASLDDFFSILEALDGVPEFDPVTTPLDEAGLGSKDGESTTTTTRKLGYQRSSSSRALQDSETEFEASPKCKRHKVNPSVSYHEETRQDGQQRMSHITVERNRRKQMNEHLLSLRSLMPSFYVKRADQASIVGGVVDYINELQQVLHSLEAKKQRKIYNEVLSPRFVSSPKPSPLSPRKPPLSPRLSLPISPRTPQPTCPYKPRLQQQGYLSPTMASSFEPSPSSSSSSSTSSIDSVNELAANSKSAKAEVEVRFSGSNVLLKTISRPLIGQVVKIISAFDELSLEILQVNISTTIDETMVLSFTIKIGIDCQLSAEELAHQIQQTFC